MKLKTPFDRMGPAAMAAAAPLVVVAATVLVAGLTSSRRGADYAAPARAPRPANPAYGASLPDAAVELSPTQLNAITIAAVSTYRFPEEKDEIGSIDFNGDRAVQVFPPYQGRILTTFAELAPRSREASRSTASRARTSFKRRTA